MNYKNEDEDEDELEYEDEDQNRSQDLDINSITSNRLIVNGYNRKYTNPCRNDQNITG
jgi:hypothetical protein